MTPDRRRQKWIDEKISAAVGKKVRRRKKMGGIDLDDQADDEVKQIRDAMCKACETDGKAREAGRPATAKLALLPNVVNVLSKTSTRSAVLEPENNILEAVKFFLEPLMDGSLPAYTIQHELFRCLEQLSINTDALVASGIGKVALFYRNSKKVEVGVQRQAIRCIEEWSRTILKRSDDYAKRVLPEAEYDPEQANMLRKMSKMSTGEVTSSMRANQNSQSAAALMRGKNRATMAPDEMKRYTVVPKSTISKDMVGRSGGGRSVGANGLYTKRLNSVCLSCFAAGSLPLCGSHAFTNASGAGFKV